MRRSPLQRRSRLKRSGFRSQPVTLGAESRQAADLERKLAAQFHDHAIWVGRCAVCYLRSPILHAHHVVEKSWLTGELKRIVPPLHLAGLRWDLRNCIPLCSICHDRHHHGNSPLRAKHVPESVYEFAAEVDALLPGEPTLFRIERRYPG